MQAPDNNEQYREVDPGTGNGGIRPILPKKSVLRTIVIVAPGRLYVKAQDAVDEHGFIEFAMASRDGRLFFSFYVRPNDACTEVDVLRLANEAGNDMLLELYAQQARRTYERGKHGKA